MLEIVLIALAEPAALIAMATWIGKPSLGILVAAKAAVLLATALLLVAGHIIALHPAVALSWILLVLVEVFALLPVAASAALLLLIAAAAALLLLARCLLHPSTAAAGRYFQSLARFPSDITWTSLDWEGDGCNPLSGPPFQSVDEAGCGWARYSPVRPPDKNKAADPRRWEPAACSIVGP